MTLKASSYEITPSLYLVVQPLSSAAAAPPPPEPTHYVCVLDCSGSMTYELPLIREQLKNRLPSLLSPGDVVSIVWFSGRGQCGVLVEAVEPNLTSIEQVKKAVDQWLRPIGLTGFKEPIERAGEVVSRTVKKGGPRRAALMFMTDGCDNTWFRPDILKAVEVVAPLFASSTFVEYGYYADKPLLSKMAERTGGALILAQDFMGYEPVFEAAMRRKGGAAKRTTVRLGAAPVGGIAYAVDDGLVLPYGAFDGASVEVPTHLTTLYYLSPTLVGNPRGSLAGVLVGWRGLASANDNAVLAGAYGALHLFAQRVQPTTIWPILRALGDVALIDAFSQCFGKQRYAAFVEATGKAAATGEGMFAKGYDAKRAPREDAFTILDLFDLLARDKRCRILTEAAGFSYSRIGRKAVGKDRMLTVTESEEVAKSADVLKDLAGQRELAPIKEWLAKLNDLVNGRKAALKFSLDKNEAERGYPIDGLVWNTDQPNLSFRVRKPGTVDIGGSDAPADVRAALPPTLETHQFRAYTVVKDGLVHIDTLPVHVPQVVADTLVAVGAIEPKDMVPEGDGVLVVVDLKKIPVINQRMISECRAKDLAEMEYALLDAKARCKVLDHYLPEKENAAFAEKFGATAAAWLKENHVTAGGYNPAATSAPPTDMNYVTALYTKIPGLSSLPKVDDVRSRMADAAKAKADPKAKKPKDLTAAMTLMAPYLEEIDAYLASPAYKEASDPQAAFEGWLQGKAREAKAAKREAERKVAMVKACLIISGSWFAEFASLDEKTIDVVLGGEKRTVTFDLDDRVEVKL